MGVPVGSKKYDKKIIKRLLGFYRNNPLCGPIETGKRMGHRKMTIYRYNEHLIEQGWLSKTKSGWKVNNE